MAHDLENANISVNTLHPGVITTKLLQKGFSMHGASLREGAETSLFLTSTVKLEGVTGKYFIDCEVKNSAPFTYDAELQENFWNASLKMIENFL